MLRGVSADRGNIKDTGVSTPPAPSEQHAASEPTMQNYLEGLRVRKWQEAISVCT